MSDGDKLNPQNFISTKDAANELGYTIQHTRLLIREGKLDAVKFGRDWLVVKESVVEYKIQEKHNE